MATLRTAPLLLLLALPTGAYADDRQDYSRPLVIYGASVGADLGSTLYALNRGAVEANPLLQTRGALVGWKAAQLGALVGIDVLLQKGGHPRMARGLRIGVVVLSGYLVVRNMRNTQAG